MLKKISIFSGVVFILGLYIFFLLKDAGSFKEIHNKSLPFCKSLPIYGAEDVAEIEDTEYLVFTSDPREYPRSKTTGILKVYSKTKEDFTYFQQVGFPDLFYPHGIDIKKFDSTYLIAVVNHPTLDSTTLETFNIDIAHREIRHLKTYENPNFTTGNDVAIISPTEVIISEDFFSNNHLFNSLTQYLRLSTGGMLHLNLQNNLAKKVGPSLFYGNGIIYDQKQKMIYVSEMLGRRILALQWTGEDLELKKTLVLPHAIDNLTFYADNIIAAGHPKLLSLKKMRDNRTEKSPSVVLQIKKDLTQIEEIYQNNGSELASSSVAIRFDNKILIGSVFDNHVLACTTD